MTNLWWKSLGFIFRRRALLAGERTRFVGEDHLGNKYYEVEKPLHDYRKQQRFFKTKDEVTSIDQLLQSTHVPPPWDAWLRFRKKDPPTEAEVLESENYFKFQQSLAKQKKLEEGDEKKVPGSEESTYEERKKMPKPPPRGPDR